jgi:hypothetical protein
MKLLSEVSPEELDWRNPEMPVIRDGIDNFTGKKAELALSPYEQQQMSEGNMACQKPSWRDDPTYNMRRRKRNGP